MNKVTEDMLQAGMRALLMCSASDLESYSPILYSGYKDDCERVYAAMFAAAPHPAVQPLTHEPFAWCIPVCEMPHSFTTSPSVAKGWAAQGCQVTALYAALQAQNKESNG